jgi:hypothetical protein
LANRVTDTLAKDFDSIIESLIDFATSEYGEQTSSNRVWTDFNVSSFSRNWAELLAYVADQLMFYLDAQSNQAYLETATIPSFILRIAQQSGFDVPTQQAASGKVIFTTSGPYTIPKAARVSNGTVEFYTTRALQGSQAEEVEVDIIQGREINQSFTAEGIQSEEVILSEPTIIVDLTNANPDLRSPIVRVNGNDYEVRTTSIEASPIDRVVTRSLLPDGRTKLTFGDGIFGRKLVANENIQIIYRIQGGSQGNLEPSEIDTIVNPIENVVSVRNDSRTNGGVDELTINQIKQRIPLALKTTSGAINIDDYGDILEANFSQVLNAKSRINNTDVGIDIDVFVLPQASTVANITDNQVLYDTLTDFLERNKTVTTRFIIKDAEEIRMLIELEVYLRRDASRSSVESEIRERLRAFFDLRTGGADEVGIQFAQRVKIGEVFDILQEIDEIDRFEVKKFTCSPRVETTKASPNQRFFTSDVDVFENVDQNEWIVVTSEIANPEPADGQVDFKVYKRTLGTITSLTEGSITDSNLDLTVKSGSGIVINSTLVTDPANVFKLGQFDDFILVDSSNNIWRIAETRSKSIVVSSPALNDASITSVSSGNYRIVKSFAGARIAVNGLIFTVLYNNRNTFFSPGSSFNIIATARTPFFLSEEQNNVGTHGVPVAITSATPQGANAGDIVNVEFNGNPNLINVDDEFVLIDRTGETFEVVQVSTDEVPITQYGTDSDVTGYVALNNTDARFVTMQIISEKEVVDSFVTVTLKMLKDQNPSGSIIVELVNDEDPRQVIAQSIPVSTALISDGAVYSSIQFTFPTKISMVNNERYFIAIYGDNAYNLSYGNGDGEIRLGLDNVRVEYNPTTTAQGFIDVLNNSTIAFRRKASASITVLDNAIRERVQATNDVTIVSNNFSGSNTIIIAGVAFTEGVNFSAGASESDTRNNLKAAIDAELNGIVTTANLGTTGILMTADATAYPGEAGNELTIEISESSPANFSIRSGTFGGGVDGDKIITLAPVFVNDSQVSYTYNSGSGAIQYQSAVTLPALVSGMKFVDGAENEFDIISIDDANDRLFIATGQTVDVTTSDVFSGSIKNSLTFEFGSDITVGVDVDDTASNIASVIGAAIGAYNVSSSLNVVDIEIDYFGSYGNTFTLETSDLGTKNLELSSDTLIGGQSSDKITVGSDVFEAVQGAPANNFEFQVGANNVTTANNLADQVNAVGNNVASLNGARVLISSSTPGSVGNLVALVIEQLNSGSFTKSGDTLTGGQDNRGLIKSSDGINFIEVIPDSDLVFSLVLATDVLTVVSKSDIAGNQIIPQISVNSGIDSCLGKRYYSDNGEISFLIATLSPNAFIVGADDANLYGRGTVGGNTNVRVDQFVFRTSKFEDDVNNLRDMEIPVLNDDDLDINILGGVQ